MTSVELPNALYLQENARRKATKRYKDTLQAAGVDEMFVERHGASTSASVRTGYESDGSSARDAYSHRSSARSSPVNTSRKYTESFEPETMVDRSENEAADLDADWTIHV